MNKTKIEYVDRTWNPITGCRHGCDYCYARRIVRRFGSTDCGGNYDLDRPSAGAYPYGFAPTFHRYRLDEPQRIKKQQNIFVCSMADLFGDWVPDEWIKKVFEACEKAPQHRYLFLTKNPKRYEQFIDMPMPGNIWFGFSQTKREYIGFDTHPSWKTFVSIEPLLERLDRAMPQGIDWAIIGAETGNRKGKIIPERLWIEEIVNDCRRIKVPVFMKDSLKELWGKPLIREYPW